MKIIYKKEAELIIKGASILSCGGGLCYEEQIKYLKIISMEKGIKILELDDIKKFSENDIFITASEIGPAELPPIDKSKIPLMIDIFQKKINKKVVGLLPVEVGQESIVFDSAVISNLPIINSDLAGLRAVPKASFNALRMQNVDFTRSPLVILTNKGDIKFFDKNVNLDQDEKQLRTISKISQGIIFVMGAIIKPMIVQKYLNFKSLTILLNIGLALQKNKLEEAIPLDMVFKEKAMVSSVNRINSQGFTEKIIELKNKKHTIKLIVKNEFIELKINEFSLFNFPQLITVVDWNKKRGLSSSEITPGLVVTIYVFNPLKFWLNYSK